MYFIKSLCFIPNIFNNHVNYLKLCFIKNYICIADFKYT